MSTPTATKLDIASIAERYFTAWETRDPDAIVALHTDGTQFWARTGIEPVRGREAVRAAFADLFERFPGFSFEVHRLLLGEDHWVLDWRLTFTLPGEPEPLGFDCLDTVELSPDGLVARKDTFIDMVGLQAALPEFDIAA